jgi:putative transposase
VLVTKYRRKSINIAMLENLRGILTDLCEKWGCLLLEFSGEADHVHLLFDTPPTVEPAKFVNNLKTVSSRLLRRDHAEHLGQFYRKPVLWTASYAIFTTGGAPLEVIKQYILGQRRPSE